MGSVANGTWTAPERWVRSVSELPKLLHLVNSKSPESNLPVNSSEFVTYPLFVALNYKTTQKTQKASAPSLPNLINGTRCFTITLTNFSHSCKKVLTWGYKENDSDNLKELGSSLLYCPNFWHCWKQNAYFVYISENQLFFFIEFCMFLNRANKSRTWQQELNRLFLFKSVASVTYWNDDDDSIITLCI